MDNRMPSVVHMNGYSRDLALASIGQGWDSLVHEIFDTLETIKGDVKIIQVKEKWGGLRVYTDVVNKQLNEVIQNCERRSFTICQVCGEAGKLRDSNSWYRTLCDQHGGDFKVVEFP